MSANVPLPWTAERLALAEREWLAGKSGQVIAEMLGRPFTRSAVIGKAQRGEWTRADGVVVVGVRGRLERSMTYRARLHRGEIEPKCRQPKPPKPTPAPPIVRAALRPTPLALVSLDHARPFMSRASRECAWLLDDGRSCCAPVSGAGSYCAGHRALVYRPTPTLDTKKMARAYG